MEPQWQGPSLALLTRMERPLLRDAGSTRQLNTHDALIPILIGLTTDTGSKVILFLVSGGRSLAIGAFFAGRWPRSLSE